ncbi:alpha/beta fold hydrolase [Saccharibacillus sp. JS10]|uniref:alpha/beta fold hydrolase n=1 Tax=Saccharibacillus sp. JS10 TaxID=2950552 RepID=UPI00210D1458|nr:alpha/beta hydrolase [Saccharibacillus sp. JS10]MCQ4088300.1 alpha/beta hydrolase [Saccharibacillus sp. JS10]
MDVHLYRKKLKLKHIELFILDTQTEGPVIVCLHGRWGRGETWADLMRRYGDRYRVIAPDQRGHGLSSKPISRYTAEEMAEDVIKLLDTLGLSSCILIGHSMGGQNAAHVAAMYPSYVSKVAILDKTPEGPKVRLQTPPEEITAIDPLTADWQLPFSDRAQASKLMSQELDSQLAVDYFMNSLTETEEGYTMMFSPQAMAANIAYNIDWYDRLTEIYCPALLIRAKDGDNMPDDVWEKAKSLLPNGIAREMPGTDHNVHLSHPELFYTYLDEFLQM